LEVSALRQASLPGLPGSLPLLRLHSDERLIELIRRGHHAAFEALVARYQTRLLAFCRHMLGSKEDAEDVLQEVFTAAFNAILADERAINVRPWLYRIARNRSLNHLRRVAPVGVDSMDVYYADGGQSTGEKILRRESFRQLVADVQQLPETQRTALLLREIDALSYEQIAETMQTTVPSVKSLLVRARISLAEAAEARKLSCEDVRLELGEVAEGLRKIGAPARRHVRECDRCRFFRKQLRENNQALAAILPVGPLLMLKKLILTKLGSTAGAGHVAAGGGATAGAAAGAAGASAGGAAGGLVSVGATAIATKAVAGLAAAVIVTAGAVEADHAVVHRHHHHPTALASSSPVGEGEQQAVPVVIRSQPQPPTASNPLVTRPRAHAAIHHRPNKPKPPAVVVPSTAVVPTTPTTTDTPVAVVKPTPPAKPVTQVTAETTELPSTPQTSTSDTTTAAGTATSPSSGTTATGTTGTTTTTTTPTTTAPTEGPAPEKGQGASGTENPAASSSPSSGTSATN
jgi:RNA polymerase sigma factor (sigma-70 family)